MSDTPTILGPIGKPIQSRASRAYKGIGDGSRGGLRNPSSGLGGAFDKGASTYFQPIRIYWRTPLELLYVESWAASKAINIPVDE